MKKIIENLLITNMVKYIETGVAANKDKIRHIVAEIVNE